MINTKQLKTLEEFQNLKKGDFLACEFHRDVYPKKIRFGVFEVVMNKEHTKEIILHKKDNTYFNYQMFIDGDSNTNLKSVILLTSN